MKIFEVASSNWIVLYFLNWFGFVYVDIRLFEFLCYLFVNVLWSVDVVMLSFVYISLYKVLGFQYL